MRYEIFRTASFKKGFKKLSVKQQNETLAIIEKLVNGESLPQKHKDHQLIGNYNGCRECHIKPDLLLIYRIKEEVVELALVEIGSHADLF